MKRTLIVGNEWQMQQAIGAQRKEFAEQGYLRITFSTDKPRTLSQNSLVYALYTQISAESGQETELEVRRRCKYAYGLAIAYEGDTEALDTLRTMLRALTYSQRMKAMDCIQVSSIMSTNQLTRYVAAIEEHEIREARNAA